MNKKVFSRVLLIGITSIPFSHAHAVGTLEELESLILKILGQIVPVFLALATVYLLWQIFRYIWLADNEEERTEARKLIVYGVIALFVMFSIWSIIAVLENTLNLNNDITIQNGVENLIIEQ
jgi:heme/copper-type cytochrome/quinol oxidase subunit 4